jgi:hypothetical protein
MILCKKDKAKVMDYRKVLDDFKYRYEKLKCEAATGSLEEKTYQHILDEIDVVKGGTPQERVMMVQTALKMLMNSIEPPETTPLVQEAYETLTEKAKLKPFLLMADEEEK